MCARLNIEDSAITHFQHDNLFIVIIFLYGKGNGIQTVCLLTGSKLQF